MRRVSSLLAITAACVGAFAVMQARSAASPNACRLLRAVVRDVGGVWALRLTRHTFTASGGGAWRCELTSAPAEGSVTPAFAVVLSFFTSPNASVAHSNLALLRGKGPALAGSGADEAFAREEHQGAATSTRVTWRRSRYWGWLSLQGPKLLGDREDAAGLLKKFLRRLPAT